MVELSDPKGPVQEGIDNTIFIIPGIIVVSLISKYQAKVYAGSSYGKLINRYKGIIPIYRDNPYITGLRLVLPILM